MVVPQAPEENRLHRLNPRLLVGAGSLQFRQARPRASHKLLKLLQLGVDVENQRGEANSRQRFGTPPSALGFRDGKYGGVGFGFQLPQVPAPHLRAPGGVRDDAGQDALRAGLRLLQGRRRPWHWRKLVVTIHGTSK